MFTGLVQDVGEIRGLESRGDLRLQVGFRALDAARLGLGSSICVDGVCLTVAALDATSFAADVSGETLRVHDARRQAGRGACQSRAVAARRRRPRRALGLGPRRRCR